MKILGCKFRLIKKDPHTVNDMMMGRADSKHAEITICTGMTKDMENKTILHEQIHVISDLLNLELSEEQVAGITMGLFASDNIMLKNRGDV
jgi:hypothetical protein